MASILMMVGGAVVNALAFTGGNYLFSQFNKEGAQAELKRHNAALEKYQKEMTDYNIKNSEYHNWLQTQFSRKQESVQSINNANKALDTYSQLEIPQPPIFDYTPSGEQINYESIFNLLGTSAMVGGALKSL